MLAAVSILSTGKQGLSINNKVIADFSHKRAI
jgi:hypothetical protein